MSTNRTENRYDKDFKRPSLTFINLASKPCCILQRVWSITYSSNTRD